MLLSSFVLVALLSEAARAQTPKDQLCLAGAAASLDYVLFSTDSVDSFASQCSSRLKITSLYATAHQYCTENDIAAYYEAKNKECQEDYGVSLMPYSDVANTFTNEYIQGLKVIHNMAEGAAGLLEKPALLSEEFFTQGYKTLESWDTATAAHDFHSFMPYVFWAAIVFSGILHRIFNAFLLGQQYEVDQDIEGRQTTSLSLPVRITSKVHRWINTHFVLPTEFGSSRRKLGWVRHRQISTRIQTIVVVLYCILIILLCATDYYTYYESLYFDTKPHQIQRHVADRMGIMAIGGLPILWAFSGRNNIILWATGWRFGTLNLYHRAIARVTMVLAIIHASAYTRYYVELQYYKVTLVEYWFRCGILTLTTISVMVGLSSSIVRQKIYDFWLLLHILLAVVVVVALYYHTSILEGKYNPFIWSIVAIWGFDRTVRLLRLAYCNLPLPLSFTPNAGTKSTAVYLKDANVIKVDVFPGPGSRSLMPRPGQHYYLYEPLRWKGYENHAFSLASWSWSDGDGDNDTSIIPDLVQSEPSEKTQIDTTPSSNPSLDVGSIPPVRKAEKNETSSHGSSASRFTFYIRPLSGWTSRLKTQCLKSGSPSPIDLTLLVEGPYGGPSPLHRFENVVLIAGGTGITAAVPYIRDHFSRASTGDTALRTRSVNLIWTAKEEAFINRIFSSKLSGFVLVQGSGGFTAECFVTSASASGTAQNEQEGSSSSLNSSSNTANGNENKQTRINTGRPDIPALIRQKIENITAADPRPGRTAVFVSGPVALADSTRGTVHKVLKETSYEVEYFEGVFGW